MITMYQKEQAYKLFQEGYTPSQVVIKLNIPLERRAISGCYTHYKQMKEEEEQIKDYRLDCLLKQEEKEMRKHSDKLDKLLDTFIEVGEQLIEYMLKEKHARIGAQKESQIEFIRQVLLHKIEQGDYSTETCEKLAKVSKVRREIKYHNGFTSSMIEHIGLFESAVKQANSIKQKNDVRKIGSFERFVNNRTNKIKEDTYKQILDEIMEG